MMRALVTGGTGFIGSNLVLELEKQGHDIVVLDKVDFGKEKNLECMKARIVKADVSRAFTIKGSFDVIFHEASITDTTFSDDKEMIRQNIEGFKKIIGLAIKNNANLIYASSAGVYGNGAVPMKEDQELKPLNAYASSKAEMDRIASDYFDKMHIVGLRYFNVFGPRELYKGKSASMIYQLAQQMKEKGNVRLFRLGEQIRDHIYVKDVVSATIKAIDAKKSGVYNVGTGIGTTFNQLVDYLKEVLEIECETEYFDNPYTKVYQVNTRAYTDNAYDNLGFKAKYSVKDGIKDYKEWLI